MRVFLQDGRTAFWSAAAFPETSVPTPMKTTPSWVMERATFMKASRSLTMVSRPIRRPPYWAMPTLMLPGNLLAYFLFSISTEIHTEWQWAEVLVVVLAVGIELGEGGGVWDIELIKGSHEWSKGNLDLSNGLSVEGSWSDLEESSSEVVDDKGASINHGWEELVELLNTSVESVNIGNICGHEDEGDTRDEGIWVSLDGHFGDNTVGSTTTAGQGPVKIGVLGAGGSDDGATGGDNPHGEGLISTETERGGEGRVATTLGVTTSNTDGCALSSNNDEAGGGSSSYRVVTLDTGTYGEGLSGVVGIRVVDDLSRLQVMSPDTEGTSTC